MPAHADLHNSNDTLLWKKTFSPQPNRVSGERRDTRCIRVAERSDTMWTMAYDMMLMNPRMRISRLELNLSLHSFR